MTMREGPMIFGDDIESPVVGRGRVIAVRLVGVFFKFLAGVAGLTGIFWIAASYKDALGLSADSDGLLPTFARLITPVAVSVLGTWSLRRVGQGLSRGSRASRWAAVCFLVPACIPPLVYFFSAVGAGSPAGAALTLLLLIPPTFAILVLADWRADPLFGSKAATIAGAATVAPVGSASPLLKIVIVVLVLVATIALLVVNSRP
jgi:hypothetical protein